VVKSRKLIHNNPSSCSDPKRCLHLLWSRLCGDPPSSRFQRDFGGRARPNRYSAVSGIDLECQYLVTGYQLLVTGLIPKKNCSMNSFRYPCLVTQLLSLITKSVGLYLHPASGGSQRVIKSRYGSLSILITTG